MRVRRGIVSNTADVLGMKGVGGMCEMCMCLDRGRSTYFNI